MPFYNYPRIHADAFQQIQANIREFCDLNKIGDKFEYEGEKFTITACSPSGWEHVEVKHDRYGGLATFELSSYTITPERGQEHHHREITITEADFPPNAPELFEHILKVPVTRDTVPCLEIGERLYCPTTSPGVVVGLGRQIGKVTKVVV